MGFLWLSKFNFGYWMFQPVSKRQKSNGYKAEQSARDRRFKEKIYYQLEHNYTNCEYNVEQLSRDMGMSRSQLFRKCKLILGQSPVKLIKCYRLQKAKEFLKSGIYNVSEAAYLSGFNSLSYFSKSFKNYYRQMPSKWV